MMRSRSLLCALALLAGARQSSAADRAPTEPVAAEPAAVRRSGFNVGIGLSGGGMQRNGVKGAGGAFNVRMEFFPLFYRGGPFQDLGVLLTAGTGGYSIQRGRQKL